MGKRPQQTTALFAAVAHDRLLKFERRFDLLGGLSGGGVELALDVAQRVDRQPPHHDEKEHKCAEARKQLETDGPVLHGNLAWQ